jgi:hypothetical protein
MDPLLNTILRHQIYLEGLKKGKNLEFFGVMGQLSVALRRDLGAVPFENLGDMSKRQLDKLLATLKRTAKSIFDAYLNDIIAWLEEYMHVDWDFFNFAYRLIEGQSIEQDEEGEEEADDNWLAILAMPIGANGILPKIFLSAVSIMGTTKITQLVTQHWVNNTKKQELIDALLGTKGAALNDGLLATLARQGTAASETVIQHVSANTNAAVALKFFAEYQWISVLDSGTTDICRARAWLKFLYGKGPLPPAHIKCRSSTIPVTSRGPLSDMPDFKVWADAQSEAFKEDAFDGKVRSRYDGSKALTLEEFKGKRSLILS